MVIAVVPGMSGHLRFNFQGYAKNGNVPGGDGPFKNGNRCIFAVSEVG